MKEELARLQKSGEQTKSLFQKIFTCASNKIEELQITEERLKKLQNEMAENASKVDSTVIINVGGKRFETFKDTLLKHGNTYFTALLGSGQFKV